MLFGSMMVGFVDCVDVDRCWFVGVDTIGLVLCLLLKYDEFVVLAESTAVWIEIDCWNVIG